MPDSNTSTPNETYLQSRLSPGQFQATVDFYEADRQLTTEDRLKIQKELQSVLVSNNFIGYSAGMVGMLSPTIYYRFFKRQTSNKVSFIQKPFLSFFIGLANMMIVSSIVRQRGFNDKLTSGDLTPRQQEVWRHMDWKNMPGFYYYYLKSAQDPRYKLHDPRTIKIDPRTRRPVETDADRSGGAVQFDPSVYRDKQFETHQQEEFHRPSFTQGVEDHRNLSHWDQIRLANGFDVTLDQKQPNVAQESARDSFTDGLNEPPVQGQNESPNTSQSSWEKLRSQK
ncbi:uncharacterized protein LODBEIA_P55170 [Lodderomyces beijingensis]|uniref:Uncharacterized protein n=1 Tax=Lodderomyces beijingensis TaxID=1775926 RepID=A0ABP0ZT38_9ASCO